MYIKWIQLRGTWNIAKYIQSKVFNRIKDGHR